MEFLERKRVTFLGLPWTFTKYIIKEDLITIKQGLLRQTENDCYMYKIQDVFLESSVMERIFKIGTVVCHTSDVTDPKLILRHIKNSKVIKDFILKESEAERRKRRTVNMLDIGVSDINDMDT